MRIKKKKKKLSYAFIGLFVIFLALSIFAYSKPESFDRHILVGVVTEEGILTHKAHFTNATVYGEFASLEYYPTRITDYILAEYKYRVTPREEGNYTLEGLVSFYVTKGKGRIYLVNETLFKYTGSLSNGMFIKDFDVNLTDVNSRRDKISEGLDLPRLNYELKILAEVKRGNKTFLQEMPIINDPASGLTYIDNTELKKRNNIVKTVKEDFYFLGMPVSKARIVFPLVTLGFGILALITWEPRKKKWNAIEARPTGITERVIVEDMKSLKKIAGIVGSPIIHYETDGINIYGVIDGQVLYEYWELKRT
ncbi:hypothetical protein PNA2_1186 [Pyrococcus sp. NA2]|uniref:hypothetical protein n=1 Tax=Pyrococcus sp. (strain NA2) TaxID=342949 RepID=UPI000209ABE2|nr:hypothetical protein [Pyrococcus sp. NA2]AEC52102.1 hypothetical protein PNA2_1186 [Pyrococcus sp. NA2]